MKTRKRLAAAGRWIIGILATAIWAGCTPAVTTTALSPTSISQPAPDTIYQEHQPPPSKQGTSETFSRAEPEAEQPKDPPYRPCIDGPGWLKQIDEWERGGSGADIKRFGRSITPEEFAEICITDCSDQLANLSALAAMTEAPGAFSALVNLWRENLDYMKWWLQNRRQKWSR